MSLGTPIFKILGSVYDQVLVQFCSNHDLSNLMYSCRALLTPTIHALIPRHIFNINDVETLKDFRLVKQVKGVFDLIDIHPELVTFHITALHLCIDESNDNFEFYDEDDMQWELGSECLPRTLETLYSNWPHRRLAVGNLPSSLRRLHVFSGIDDIKPGVLPHGLISLEVAEQIPSSLPSSLIDLKSCTQLTDVMLPKGLHTLCLEYGFVDVEIIPETIQMLAFQAVSSPSHKMWQGFNDNIHRAMSCTHFYTHIHMRASHHTHTPTVRAP